MSDIREFAIAVLDEQNGISEAAWDKLAVLLLADEEGDNKDLIGKVEKFNGRVFLPEES